MITTAETARQFAQSIATQAVQLQDAIDRNDYSEKTADLMGAIADDVARLETYVYAKCEAQSGQ